LEYITKEKKKRYNAISTSNLAKYEYTSGDIRYLRIPANTINERDFVLTAASVCFGNEFMVRMRHMGL
jgi:hypothetical protein